ncbi:MAG: tetratricopeptide repeat protein [PVC group bacterium]
MTGPDQKPAVLLSAAVLIAAGVLVYWNSFQGAFVFDDIRAIVNNPHIRQVFPLGQSLTGPWDSTVRDRPVASFTLALNYALDGLRPRGYHAFNLAVHILAGLALFGILRRTFSNQILPPPVNRSADGLALAASLLWLVHPLQTESVTYIIQRSESLAGLFYLLTLYCFIRGTSSPVRRCWLGASILFCALGMGTKSMMITAPLIVLAYDAVFTSRSLKNALKKHWAVFLALGSTWTIQLLIISRTSYADLKGLSPTAYFITEPGVITHLIRLAFWPYPLCLDYGWPLSQSIGRILPPALFIGGLLWATVWALIKQPTLGFAGVWFFLTLAPTSSILPLEDPVFEHRIYLPLAAIATLVVVGTCNLIRRIQSKKNRRMISLSFALGAVLILGFLTMKRNELYRDPLALWREIAALRPEHARGHYNYGLELSKAGLSAEAIEEYREAVRLKPDYADAYNNLGAALADQGDFIQAINYYGRAVRARPDFWVARFNMGMAFNRLGKHREAEICFREVTRIRPGYAPAFYQTAESLREQGKAEEAKAYYHQALQLNPEPAPDAF